METVQIIALSMGAAWASGINLYATVFMLGMLGGHGYVELPPELELVTDPLVITTAGVMYLVEFFMDKTPGVDTAWDSIHTFIRIPAGAVMAMGAVGQTEPALELTALLLGGTLTAGTHAAKSGSRVLINTSPEPVSNWTASLGEDVLVVTGLWAALMHPWVFLAGLIVFIVIMLWLLPKIWKGIKNVFYKIRGFFSANTPTEIESELLSQAPQIKNEN